MPADVRIRPAATRDARALRALVDVEVGRTPYAELAQASVEAVMSGSPELRALVAERGDELIGVVIFGPVAGTVGTAKLHLILVTASARLQGVARLLGDAAVAAVVAEGARLVVAEMPDVPGLRAGRVLLERCGWREEGRIEDFFADGTALALLRRDCDDAG